MRDVPPPVIGRRLVESALVANGARRLKSFCRPAPVVPLSLPLSPSLGARTPETAMGGSSDVGNSSAGSYSPYMLYFSSAAIKGAEVGVGWDIYCTYVQSQSTILCTVRTERRRLICLVTWLKPLLPHSFPFLPLSFLPQSPFFFPLFASALII